MTPDLDPDPTSTPTLTPTATTTWTPERLALAFVAASLLLHALLSGFVPLSPQETYYWQYARHLDLSYFDHPPLAAWTIRLTTALLGEGERGVRAAALVHGAIFGLFFFLTGRRLFGSRAAFAATVAALLTPLYALGQSVITPDAPLLSGWVAALYFTVRALDEERGPWLLAAGGAVGLAALGKYTGWLLAPQIFLALLLDRRGRRLLASPWPWLALAVAVMTFLPVLVWNARHAWSSFGFQFGLRAAEASPFSPRRFGSFLGLQALAHTPLLFAGLWVAAAAAALRWREAPYRLCALFALPGFLLFLALSPYTWVKGNWPAPAYPAALLAAAGLVQDASSARRRYARAALVVAAVGTLYLHLALAFPSVPFPARQDVDERLARAGSSRRRRAGAPAGAPVRRRLHLQAGERARLLPARPARDLLAERARRGGARVRLLAGPGIPGRTRGHPRARPARVEELPPARGVLPAAHRAGAPAGPPRRPPRHHLPALALSLGRAGRRRRPVTGGARLVAGGRELLPLAAFLALVALVDLADWNEGPTRAAGLALAAAGLAWLWQTAPVRPVAARRWLGAALAMALLRAAVSLTAPERSGSPNDIGWTTVRAVEVRAAGRSPYASLVDPQRDLPRREPGFGWFVGYKYGPVVPAYYRAFLQRFGVPLGLYLGNALLLALAAALVAILAGQVGGARAALAAVTALLWPELGRHELFQQGVNDLLPTVLGLAALFVATQPGRAASAFSGALLGLSLAAKPLPGALLLLLLPGAVAAVAPFAAGVALGLLPYLPDLLATPRELVANLVLFNLARPGDSTGLATELRAGCLGRCWRSRPGSCSCSGSGSSWRPPPPTTAHRGRAATSSSLRRSSPPSSWPAESSSTGTTCSGGCRWRWLRWAPPATGRSARPTSAGGAELAQPHSAPDRSGADRRRSSRGGTGRSRSGPGPRDRGGAVRP